MVETHIISGEKEIRKILPECNKLAKQVNALIPFNYIESSLIWWANFNNCDGSLFSQKRGTNFLGTQSKLINFFLLIAKDKSTVCGAIPLASFKVKIPHVKSELNVLCFAGDYGLFPFQDFLTASSERALILSSMLSKIIQLFTKDYDFLFMGYLPENSPNIPELRAYFSNFLPKDIYFSERKTGQRGGVRPWTVHAILSILKKTLKSLNEGVLIQQKLGSLIEKIESSSELSLLLSGTRTKIEKELLSILNELSLQKTSQKQIEAINSLLSNTEVLYPYITLPPEINLYLENLSYKTRRSYNNHRNRFLKSGGIFEKIPAKIITDKDINDYIHLHLDRWGESSATLRSVNNNFHKELLYFLIENEFATLFFAKLNGIRIASLSCIDIFSNRLAYLSGRMTGYEKYSAGSILIMHSIYDAIDSGFKLFDFSLGGFSYKLSLASDSKTTNCFLLNKSSNTFSLDELFSGYEFMGIEVKKPDAFASAYPF